MAITNADLICINCMRERPDDGVCPYCGFDEAQYEPSPHHLQPRSILGGKCLVGRVLGEGGFGITYMGWDLNLDLKLAIKEYFPTGFVTRTNTATSTVMPYRGEKTEFFTTGRSRFINEAKTLAKYYSLPGIVYVRDFFLENGTAYIVMEFVEGETLKQRLARVGGRISASEVLDLMRPLLRSLAEMHASGLIHRDISPDNIMITPENNVKLIDFGAARDYLDSGNRSLSVMLKPGFAPEEQYFARGEQGPWTDIYSLCATIYRAMTGVTPPESVERLRNDELKAPSMLGAHISPAQEAALLRGLAVSHEERWQTVPELYAMLYAGEQGNLSAPSSAFVQNLSPEKSQPQQKSLLKRHPRNSTATATSNSVMDASNPANSDQKASSRRKKGWIPLVAGLSALVLLIAASFVMIFVGRTAALRAMDAMNFDLAAGIFYRIPFGSTLFPDEEEYLSAARLTIDHSFEDARHVLSTIGGYREAETALTEVSYQEGLYELSEKNYDRAMQIFTDLGTYRDSADQLKETRFSHASDLSAAGEYDKALTILNTLNGQGYEPAKQLILDLSIKVADQFANDGDYGKAYGTLRKVEDFGDVATKLSDYRELAYRKGIELYGDGTYYGARMQLINIRGYLRADDYLFLIDMQSKSATSIAQMSRLKSLIGFEDAASLLVKGQIIAEKFLAGYWSGDGYYLEMSDEGYLDYNLPYIDYGDYYRIEDGKVLFFPEDAYASTKQIFRFTVVSADCIQVYAYQNRDTYTLYRS